MGKTIKMMWASKDHCIFIYGATEQGEVVFRASRNIQHLQREMVLLKEGICHTTLYNFPLTALEGLPVIP